MAAALILALALSTQTPHQKAEVNPSSPRQKALAAEFQANVKKQAERHRSARVGKALTLREREDKDERRRERDDANLRSIAMPLALIQQAATQRAAIQEASMQRAAAQQAAMQQAAIQQAMVQRAQIQEWVLLQEWMGSPLQVSMPTPYNPAGMLPAGYGYAGNGGFQNPASASASPVHEHSVEHATHHEHH